MPIVEIETHDKTMDTKQNGMTTVKGNVWRLLGVKREKQLKVEHLLDRNPNKHLFSWFSL